MNKLTKIAIGFLFVFLLLGLGCVSSPQKTTKQTTTDASNSSKLNEQQKSPPQSQGTEFETVLDSDTADLTESLEELDSFSTDLENLLGEENFELDESVFD